MISKQLKTSWLFLLRAELHDSHCHRMEKRNTSDPPTPRVWTAQVHFSSAQVPKSCPALCDPMDCSLPGSSVHGISLWVTWEAPGPLTHVLNTVHKVCVFILQILKSSKCEGKVSAPRGTTIYGSKTARVWVQTAQTVSPSCPWVSHLSIPLFLRQRWQVQADFWRHRGWSR